MGSCMFECVIRASQRIINDILAVPQHSTLDTGRVAMKSPFKCNKLNLIILGSISGLTRTKFEELGDLVEHIVGLDDLKI